MDLMNNKQKQTHNKPLTTSKQQQNQMQHITQRQGDARDLNALNALHNQAEKHIAPAKYKAFEAAFKQLHKYVEDALNKPDQKLDMQSQLQLRCLIGKAMDAAAAFIEKCKDTELSASDSKRLDGANGVLNSLKDASALVSRTSIGEAHTMSELMTEENRIHIDEAELQPERTLSDEGVAVLTIAAILKADQAVVKSQSVEYDEGEQKKTAEVEDWTDLKSAEEIAGLEEAKRLGLVDSSIISTICDLEILDFICGHAPRNVADEMMYGFKEGKLTAINGVKLSEGFGSAPDDDNLNMPPLFMKAEMASVLMTLSEKNFSYVVGTSVDEATKGVLWGRVALLQSKIKETQKKHRDKGSFWQNNLNILDADEWNTLTLNKLAEFYPDKERHVAVKLKSLVENGNE